MIQYIVFSNGYIDLIFGTHLAYAWIVPFGAIDRPSAEGVVTRASLFPDLEWWWCGLPCRPRPWSACRRGRARLSAANCTCHPYETCALCDPVLCLELFFGISFLWSYFENHLQVCWSFVVGLAKLNVFPYHNNEEVLLDNAGVILMILPAGFLVSGGADVHKS